MWSLLGFLKDNFIYKKEDQVVDMLEVEEPNVLNGLLLSDTYFPEEVLLNILVHVSWKDLLNCRLVCQTWKRVIDYPLSAEKLEKYSTLILNSSFSPSRLRTGNCRLKADEIPFYIYYFISKGLFTKNLLENPFGSGEDPHVCQRPTPRRQWGGMENNICNAGDCPRFKHWTITESGGDGWIVETEPIGSQPLPEHLVKRSCFATSFRSCKKHQLIDLLMSGFSEKIMDEIRPYIEVSEWYARRFDCGVQYCLKVSLLNGKKEIVDVFEKKINEREGDDWHQVSFVFKDYGPGVRFVRFEHKGQDTQFWAGHYGSKMAGGSVVVRIPLHLYQNSTQSD